MVGKTGSSGGLTGNDIAVDKPDASAISVKYHDDLLK
jgi:hypothetical protein